MDKSTSILEEIYLEDQIRMDMPKTVAADKKLAQALESLKALKLENYMGMNKH